MARRIELQDDGLHVHYDGLSSAAVVARELAIPYEGIREVRIGLDDLPGTFAFKVGTNTAPFGNTRRGRFWSGGRRLFLDMNDPERAVVLELEGQTYARVALGVDDPETFAAQLRERIAGG